MKKELQEKLFKSYPDLFVQRSLPVQKSAMPWGICCGDGWYDIIELLCAEITNRIENVNRNIDYKLKESAPSLIPYNLGYLKCEATQVKEKFGGLRFYVDCDDDYIDGLISFAESMSYKTCSECGAKSSNQVKRGWIYTLCSPCRDKKTNEKERLGKTDNI